MAVLQGGQSVPLMLAPGVGTLNNTVRSSNYAQFGTGGGISASPANPGAVATVAPKVSTIWYFFAVILLLIGLKFAVEHERTKMDFSFAGIGVYNFIVITIMALLGIITFKVILNKWQVPGLTDLINVA